MPIAFKREFVIGSHPNNVDGVITFNRATVDPLQNNVLDQRYYIVDLNSANGNIYQQITYTVRQDPKNGDECAGKQ